MQYMNYWMGEPALKRTEIQGYIAYGESNKETSTNLYHHIIISWEYRVNMLG